MSQNFTCATEEFRAAARQRAKARRIAREIAVRYPLTLAQACTRTGGDVGAALAWAWIDMTRDGELDPRALPLAEILALLGVERDEIRGPLRRRLAKLARALEDLDDAEWEAAMAAGDIDAAA